MTFLTVRRTAHLGVLAALAYAGLKTAWGFGSTVGVVDVVAFERFTSAFGNLEWLATWGTTALALLAATILLALVEPWGTRLPRRPLRLLAWTGALVLAIPGFLGVGESLLTYVSLLDPHENGMAEWVFLVVYGSFAMLTVAFVVAARPRKMVGSA